jgi:hypothetical protein
MFFGNAALAFVVVWIALESRGSLSVRDITFAAVLAALVLARYVDIVKYRGATAEGAPATMEHFRRYAVRVIAVSLATWGVLHASVAL